ncbi:hypothetical protein TW65_01757 [Stemphylium lycopersici]|nr:hypothetical protein TW65_01757 [Stemphylium lycopersici]
MSMALPTAARSPKPYEPRRPEKRIPATWKALPSTQGMGGKI